MRRKDAGALIIGSAMVIFVIFYVLPALGIVIHNPFLPTAYATVTITPQISSLIHWYIDETTTLVTFSTTSTGIEIVPLGYYYPICVGPFGGGAISVQLSIPALNYRAVQPTIGTYRICHDPVTFTFPFNYEKGKCYAWTLKVLDNAGQWLYQKTGTECL